MKVSYNWLNELIDVSSYTPKEVAEALLLAGHEYESIETLGAIDHLVIGEVKELEAHPNAEKLRVATIVTGTEEQHTIVCGAPNIAKGQRVIVALPGAKLSFGKIKRAKLRGVESAGMICSLAELGIDKKYLSDVQNEGIEILPEDAPIGAHPMEYLGLKDTMIEFELTADRGDCLSYFGMMHEVSAVLDIPKKEMDLCIADHLEGESNISVQISTEDSKVYYAREIRNVTVSDSPQWLKSKLIKNGIRPINNVVDITNLVMLEIGQPLHAFDYDKLPEKEITVRKAKENEVLVTLDGKERILESTDLIITSGDQPIALGGIMGGEATEVSSSTHNILLEAAHFSQETILVSTKRHKLRSDSSNRFSKGLDIERTKLALDYASYLLHLLAGGTVCHEAMSGSDVFEPKTFVLLEKDVEHLLGVSIEPDEICRILQRLGIPHSYECNDHQCEFVIKTLSRRPDIQIKEDCIEEIARIYGYGNIRPVMLEGVLDKKENPKHVDAFEHILDILIGYGMNETLNYSLVPKEKATDFALEFTSDMKTIELLSPLTEERSTMRTSLIPSLLDVVSYNLAHGNSDIRVTELANVYAYNGDGSLYESFRISGAISGEYSTDLTGKKTPYTFFDLKSVVCGLEDICDVSEFIFQQVTDHPMYHKGRCASIMLKDTILGYIGQVHPHIAEKYGIKKEVYVFEMYGSPFLDIVLQQKQAKQVPQFPGSYRDLTFNVEKNQSMTHILSLISEIRVPYLINVVQHARYVTKEMEYKAVTYRLNFQKDEGTLTDEEVQTSIDKVLKHLETYGYTL